MLGRAEERVILEFFKLAAMGRFRRLIRKQRRSLHCRGPGAGRNDYEVDSDPKTSIWNEQKQEYVNAARRQETHLKIWPSVTAALDFLTAG